MDKFKVEKATGCNIIHGNVAGDVTHSGGNICSDKTYIYKVAEEIKEILPCTVNSHSEKVQAANKVIEHIECNKSLSDRLLKSFKDGAINSLEQALNHPAASFIVAAIRSWKDKKPVAGSY